MDMQEFKTRKRELIVKWGDKLIMPTQSELSKIYEDILPLCRFARMRPEKMLSGMASAWLRKEY